MTHCRTTQVISAAIAITLSLTILSPSSARAQDDIDPTISGASCSNTTLGVTCVATYHNDNLRDGVNLNENALKPGLFNLINPSQSNFGRVGTTPASGTGALDGLVYAQPLFLSSVSMSSTSSCPGTQNIILVATENNSAYAYTYTYTLSPTGYTFSMTLCWKLNLNIANANENAIAFTHLPTDPSTGDPCNNIVPESGITSTPVIDTAVKPPVMYVVTAHQIPL
jgi:hypothetical protein